MNEISEYFGGNRSMGQQYVDTNYSNWFKTIGERIEEWWVGVVGNVFWVR
jgi:hypothetical protein